VARASWRSSRTTPTAAVYTVKFAGMVIVLHGFQKKSKRGITTPKEGMDIIRARLKVAEALAKELADENARD